MPESAEAMASPWGRSGPELAYADEVDAASRMEIEAVLGAWDPGLFPGREVAISVLVGGANNRNFVVSSGEEKYALRIANPQNERFAVDRDSAIQAQRDASLGGLAPQVHASKLPEGHVLSAFLEGVTLLGTEQLHETRVLRTVGECLRLLHALPTSIRSFSPFNDIRLWARLARQDGGELPADLDDLLAAVWRIETVVQAAAMPAVFCHNDTVPQNFILDGERLRLVDWDYAGRGWASFELASFATTADLDEDLEEVLLRAYDADVGDAQRATIELLRFVAAMRETSWVLMAAPLVKGTTTLEDDRFYENYLRDNLLRARRLLAAADFEGLLHRAAAHQGARSW